MDFSPSGESLKSLAKAWPCAGSAILLLAAFPPFHLSLLVFVALTPWLASLKEPDARGFRSGWTFGFVYMLGQMFWLLPFVSKWTHSVPLAIIPWILAGLITAPFFGLAGWLIKLCWKNDWPWLIPVVWTGVEVLRSYFPVLAFPWGLAATPLADFPALMGLGHYGMIFFASAWCILPSVALAQAMSGQKFVEWRTSAMLFAFGLAISVVYWSLPESGEAKTILIAQPGADLAFGDPQTEAPRLKEAIDPILAQARLSKPDLVLLPEGVAGENASFPPDPPFPIDPHVPVLFGGVRDDGTHRYQTAFGFDGKWTYADKTRLVIFGEFVPGRNWIPFLSAFNLPSGDLDAAKEIKAVDVNGIRTGPLLCFEGLFPDLAFRQATNKAQVIAVMAIDDWYIGTNAPEQLAQGAPWRAVEAGLPVVRSASTGISLATDARGNILAKAPMGIRRALPARVVLPSTPQFFPLAPIFPMLALLSLIGVPIAVRLKRKKSGLVD